MIDLRRLQVLRAVAYHGTVTAAATALNVSPSAVSQQIRQLGRELGAPLLEPRGRSVQLSDAGQTLLAHADAIETRWQEAQAQLAGPTDEPRGILRLAGFATAVAVLLAPAAVRLAERFPRMTVRVRETEPDHGLALLFSGELDLVIIENTPDMPHRSDARFDQHTLLIEPFDLVVPPAHPLAGRDTIALPETAGEPWIISGPETSARPLIMAACSSAGFTPNVVHEGQEWSVMAALVAHGQGIALIPRFAQVPAQPPATRIAVTAPFTPQRHLIGCTRKGSATHPRIITALDVLGEIAAALQNSTAPDRS